MDQFGSLIHTLTQQDEHLALEMRRVAQLGTQVLPLCIGKIRRMPENAALYSSVRISRSRPNPRIDVDPDLQMLMQDVDMALNKHSKREQQQLEIIPKEEKEADFEDEPQSNLHRKSPAALFGSQRVGAVVIPHEMQDIIQRLFSDVNKAQLHSDAKRLFQKDIFGADEWDHQYEGRYHTHIQGVKHAKRDGTAFVSVALPAHYSVIYAVLDHVKQRLGRTWRPECVLDWGAGVGSGLWASLYSFQGPEVVDHSIDDFRISDSRLKSYVCIEKRDGLSQIGRRLIESSLPETVSLSWKKEWFAEDGVLPTNGGGLVALSAFLLTTLPNPLARKNLVQEIWSSGANTIILIDHDSKEGFEAVAAARLYLLSLGQKDLLDQTSDVSGCHVVAPCPHDGACPLFHPGTTKLVCSYSQRLQRPEFVRRTKHSGTGHEDIGYSYVVIQRGPRPCPTITGLGRIGAVGKRELEKEASKTVKELQVHDDRLPEDSHLRDSEQEHSTTSMQLDQDYDEEQTREAIRLEAFQWPRLVFPPLKRSGHVIIDGCTAQGKIMRMTIPRSQGKQPYYDARKSGWGDIFPHPSKNKPQERQHVLKSGSHSVPGSDIGKRSSSHTMEAPRYAEIAKAVRDDQKRLQREKRRAARQSTWEDLGDPDNMS